MPGMENTLSRSRGRCGGLATQTGVLISAPLTLVIAAVMRGEAEFSRSQVTEATAVMVALCGLGAVALAGKLPIYLVMPPLLWAAVRFEFLGAVTATALLTLIIAIFTRSDLTQFTQQGASDLKQYASMQLFLAMAALIGLVVAAISKQWRQALVNLSAANDELEARVAQRTAALQESETRFRNMADHAPVMSWITDAQGQCTFLSRSWYEFTGQTEGAGLRAGWLSAVHPEDSEEAGRKFSDANAAQVPFRLKYRLKRGDGEWRWAIDAARPRFGGNGEFLGYIGSVLDITERHEAEEQKHLLLREVNRKRCREAL
jgi:PAS domain S-box-containing protein